MDKYHKCCKCREKYDWYDSIAKMSKCFSCFKYWCNRCAIKNNEVYIGDDLPLCLDCVKKICPDS